MKHLFALSLAALLASPAAAVDDRTPEQSLRDRQAVARYYLAAAEAEGDVLSDAYVLKLLALSAGDKETVAKFDPALVARMDVARARLAARVDAARDKDPVLLSSQLRCPPSARKSPECDEDLARLAELAGDNGYHHFLLMGYAWAREDADGFLRHAALAALAPRFDQDIVPVFRAVQARLQQAPEDLLPRPYGERLQAPAAGLTAMSVAAAFALPAYQHYVSPCREAQGTLRADCLAIAGRLLHEGQTAVDFVIARAIFDAIGTPEQQARARDVARTFAWQTRHLTGMESSFSRSQWQDYFDAYAQHGEYAALRSAMESLGLPSEPPKGWRETGEGADAP